MAKPDPRITPYRDDLAASSLKSKISVKAYADPVRHFVRTPLVGVFKEPTKSSMMDSQLVYGTGFDVYEQSKGWAWGQEVPSDRRRKGYVGYVATSSLSDKSFEPKAYVSSLRAPVFAKPDIKSQIKTILPLNARVDFKTRAGSFWHIPGLGYGHENHFRDGKPKRADFVEFAEMHLGLPYIWGGIGSDGLDCSGLVLSALRACGKSGPRDTDMQEKSLGKSVPVTRNLSGLMRGDLVFWKGHVGIMINARTLLHANAYHMAVERESLKKAARRIAKSAGPITSIKRMI